MNAKQFVKWAPRILAILFTIFISIFAFDVFDQGYTVPELITALFIHLLPTMIFAGFTYLAWKTPRVGGVAFIVLSLLTIFVFHTYEQWYSFLIVTLIPFVTGILFLLNKEK